MNFKNVVLTKSVIYIRIQTLNLFIEFKQKIVLPADSEFQK